MYLGQFILFFLITHFQKLNNSHTHISIGRCAVCGVRCAVCDVRCAMCDGGDGGGLELGMLVCGWLDIYLGSVVIVVICGGGGGFVWWFCVVVVVLCGSGGFVW